MKVQIQVSRILEYVSSTPDFNRRYSHKVLRSIIIWGVNIIYSPDVYTGYRKITYLYTSRTHINLLLSFIKLAYFQLWNGLK